MAIAILVAVLALVFSGCTPRNVTPESHASDPKGTIVRVHGVGGLVFISLGEEDGVAEGDLFDVLSSADSDTVAIGQIEAVQVLTMGMSVAKVIRLREGTDPLLLKVAKVLDPARVLQIREQHKDTATQDST